MSDEQNKPSAPKRAVDRNVWSQIQLLLSRVDQRQMWANSAGQPLPSTFSRSTTPHEFVAEPGQFTNYNRDVVLLRKLYGTFTPRQQADVPLVLRALLRKENARIIASVVVELHLVDSDFAPVGAADAAQSFWTGLADKLAMEPTILSDDELSAVMRAAAAALKAVMQENPPRASGIAYTPSQDEVAARRLAFDVERLRKVIEGIRRNRLASQLYQEQNPIVDTDRRTLIGRLEQLGFSNDLEVALRQVDRKAQSATTPLDFRDCIDGLRVFFENFMREAGRLVQAKAGEPVPAEEKAVLWKNYLRKVGIIGDSDMEMMQSIYNYLSNRGTHRLRSEPEEFHVMKTTVIEWALLLAGRVRSYLQ